MLNTIKGRKILGPSDNDNHCNYIQTGEHKNLSTLECELGNGQSSSVARLEWKCHLQNGKPTCDFFLAQLFSYHKAYTNHSIGSFGLHNVWFPPGCLSRNIKNGVRSFFGFQVDADPKDKHCYWPNLLVHLKAKTVDSKSNCEVSTGVYLRVASIRFSAFMQFILFIILLIVLLLLILCIYGILFISIRYNIDFATFAMDIPNLLPSFTGKRNKVPADLRPVSYTELSRALRRWNLRPTNQSRITHESLTNHSRILNTLLRIPLESPPNLPQSQPNSPRIPLESPSNPPRIPHESPSNPMKF